MNLKYLAAKEDDEAFEEKMSRLTAQLVEQMKEASELDGAIRKNLESIGYGI